jgi:alanyl-tRNA synthetase
VSDVRWGGGGRISHRVKVESGFLAVGDGVIAKVDAERRKASQRNHTATHLLHAALRAVLGGHVRQAGSLVAPERLRFDFTHYEPVGAEEIRSVEDSVNAGIMDNLPVRIAVEDFEKARARGAMALFGEKYGEQVRVVEIPGASCELCGGTHVAATGEIGSFRVIWESGIAAGVRRIEAVTGSVAVETAREASGRLERVAAILKVPARDLEEGAAKIAESCRGLEKEVGELRRRLAGQEAGEMMRLAEEVKGIRLIASVVSAADMEILKEMADRLQEDIGDGVVCLGAGIENRAAIVVSVGAGAVARGVKASLIAKKIGEAVGGRGGGKDGFAQAGGKNPEALGDALKRCRQVIAELAR